MELAVGGEQERKTSLSLGGLVEEMGTLVPLTIARGGKVCLCF